MWIGWAYVLLLLTVFVQGHAEWLGMLQRVQQLRWSLLTQPAPALEKACFQPAKQELRWTRCQLSVLWKKQKRWESACRDILAGEGSFAPRYYRVQAVCRIAGIALVPVQVEFFR